MIKKHTYVAVEDFQVINQMGLSVNRFFRLLMNGIRLRGAAKLLFGAEKKNRTLSGNKKSATVTMEEEDFRILQVRFLTPAIVIHWGV
ncbi:MAG: hypothetical protein ACTSPB_07420, partial [Candidatus Thorarchaeota archaeon]